MKARLDGSKVRAYPSAIDAEAGVGVLIVELRATKRCTLVRENFMAFFFSLLRPSDEIGCPPGTRG